MHMVLVAGARPNFMKVQPVLATLEAREQRTTLVHTGQHYDRAMSDVFFEELGLRQPDHHLGVGSGSHAAQTAAVMTAFEPLLDELVADAVVVVGDVNSTMACAIVAAKAGAVVAHVEAGLRSRDWSMPEEVNRVVTDRVSDLLFAPSEDAVANLVAEGYRADQIHLVGNVMVDTLLANYERAQRRPVTAAVGQHPFGLVTLHRPANVDEADVFDEIWAALCVISKRLPLVFPAHPRTVARLAHRRVPAAIDVREPLGYLDFIALEGAATLVLTDSGGVQEETTMLGVPCLTLRDNTERPATVDEGTNRVVGRDARRIVAAAREALVAPPPPRRPALWDGKAAERITDALLHRLESRAGPRPTDRS